MSVSGIAGALSLQFDFTNITNRGLSNAAQQLAANGSISILDESQLVGIASGVDDANPGGGGLTASGYLNSPLKINILDDLRQDVVSSDRTAQPETAALYDGILSALQPYQNVERPDLGSSISAAA